MARQARIVAAGLPHHITQRGNNLQEIFRDDADRRAYLTILTEESAKYNVGVLAYCLMSNHVHVVVIPAREDSLSLVFKNLNLRYAIYFNRKYGASGHLWQGRYYSCVMGQSHLHACVSYVERNPVRAFMCRRAVDYAWSSARIHCDVDHHDVLGVNRLFDYTEFEQKQWKEYLDQDDAFREKVLLVRKKGRPKKCAIS